VHDFQPFLGVQSPRGGPHALEIAQKVGFDPAQSGAGHFQAVRLNGVGHKFPLHAQADTKTAIFENLCDLYNYLDASIHVQFSFINRKIDPKQYAKSFEIRAQGDDFDD